MQKDRELQEKDRELEEANNKLCDIQEEFKGQFMDYERELEAQREELGEFKSENIHVICENEI